MDLLSLGNRGALPPLLAHAVEVMQRTHSLAQRIGIRNRGRDIRFGEKNRLGQSAAMRQVAGQRGGERASGAVGGIRTLTVSLEDFLLGASGGSEAEEIDRLLALTEVASGDHHIRRSQRVQTSGRLALLFFKPSVCVSYARCNDYKIS